MSLGIVVTTEEGIVLAAESLGTLISRETQQLSADCSKCGTKVKPNMACPSCGEVIGPVPDLTRTTPSTHTYHCQKLFQLNKYTGLIIVGNPHIGRKKVQHIVNEYKIWQEKNGRSNGYAEETVDAWKEFCESNDVYDGHNGDTQLVFSGIKDSDSPAAFIQSIILHNENVNYSSVSSSGIMVAGVHEILDKMFGEGNIRNYPVKDFPLQDAVEFAEFLLQTQIGVDKYTNRIPRLGGHIDIAIVHPSAGFKWVQVKELHSLIYEE